MTSKKPNDFAGAIGDEYELIKLAIPNYDRFQQSVADAAKRYCKEVKKSGPVGVLEIGVGTGITTELILRANRRIKVLGIDKAENMLQQAEDKLRPYLNSDRLILARREASTFFRDTCWCSSFDIVASAYTIHNMPDDKKRKLFKEVYMALVPGGILIEADIISHDNEVEHKRELAIRLGNLEAFENVGKHREKEEWIAHHRYDDKLGIRMTEDQLKEMLREAGFRNITRKYREHLEATFVARK